MIPPMEERSMTPRAAAPMTRPRFLAATATAGLGLAVLGPRALAAAASRATAQAARAAASAPAGACSEDLQQILNLAYTVERAATTFYYTGLTSRGVMRSPRLAGGAGEVSRVARNGNSENVANLQAALDQEQKHAAILAAAGAESPYSRFYFPASAFLSAGYTSRPGTFLWVLDHLETACIALYLAAVRRFGELGRPDLAVLCARNLAVESEHRALYRVIATDDPADNITLPFVAFGCVDDALTLFAPYLSGHGFPHGLRVTQAVPLPTPAQTARVIGRNTSS